MARSSYEYSIIAVTPEKVGIVIWDKNVGMSVTNDIKNVVDEISASERLNPKDCLIVYRDSMGIWDGWSAVNNEFIALQCKTWAQAIDKIQKT